MATNIGFQPPKPDATNDTPAAIRQHTREIAGALRVVMQGGLNAVGTFTCTSGTATSTFVDPRLTQQGVALFDPLTANAAAELAAGTLFITSANRSKGTWTVTHASAATGDRSFRVLIIG